MQSNPCQQSADLPRGPQCLGHGPSLVGEGNSLNAKTIKQGVPLRSPAAWNKVVLHLCREGDVLHPLLCGTGTAQKRTPHRRLDPKIARKLDDPHKLLRETEICNRKSSSNLAPRESLLIEIPSCNFPILRAAQLRAPCGGTGNSIAIPSGGELDGDSPGGRHEGPVLCP